MHDGARCKAGLVAAMATFKHTWSSLKTPWFTDLITRRAFETFWPSDTLQMPSACRLIGEEMLKLQQSSRVI